MANVNAPFGLRPIVAPDDDPIEYYAAAGSLTWKKYDLLTIASGLVTDANALTSKYVAVAADDRTETTANDKVPVYRKGVRFKVETSDATTDYDYSQNHQAWDIAGSTGAQYLDLDTQLYGHFIPVELHDCVRGTTQNATGAYAVVEGYIANHISDAQPAQAATIASATAIRIPGAGLYTISGTTTMVTWANGGLKPGDLVGLQFSGAVTLTHDGGAPGFLLKNAANAKTAANDKYLFMYDGADLVEMHRQLDPTAETIASATTITIGRPGIKNITGTTTMVGWTNDGLTEGDIVTLVFAGALTFSDDGAEPGFIVTGGDFTTGAGDKSTLYYDGTDLVQIALENFT